MTPRISPRSQDREGTAVMDRTLNLSGLHRLLHDTLLITEAAKEVLRADCEEAAFASKPWPMRIAEKRREECTCKKVAVESEVEELAAGIDRALILAQGLREKVKSDVEPPRRSPKRNPTARASPSAPALGSNGRKSAPRTSVATQRANVARSVVDGKSSAASRSGTSKAVTSAASKSAVDRKQTRTSLGRSAARHSRSERNFILENKLSVKKMIPPNKPQGVARDSGNISRASKKSPSPTTLGPELSSLIHKMAQRFTENSLISSSSLGGNESDDCPLHGGEQIVERTVMIDAAEALRYFNVPSEIVEALKASHAFLKKADASNSSDTKKDKAKRSIGNFLKEFEAMNASVEDNSEEGTGDPDSSSPRLIKLARESILLFSDTFARKLSPTQLNDVQNWLTKSATVSKRRSAESHAKDRVLEGPRNFSLTSEWMSNGVWNASCVKYLKSFCEARYISYSNEKQLLSLYETMQTLQRTEYQKTLIGTILRDVIPAIRSNLDPASSEFARAYKTMSILCQGLNPEVPVLVRTDG